MRAHKGQAMVEYTIAFAALSIVVTLLFALVKTIYRYSERTDNLVASEYP